MFARKPSEPIFYDETQIKSLVRLKEINARFMGNWESSKSNTAGTFNLINLYISQLYDIQFNDSDYDSRKEYFIEKYNEIYDLIKAFKNSFKVRPKTKNTKKEKLLKLGDEFKLIFSNLKPINYDSSILLIFNELKGDLFVETDNEKHLPIGLAHCVSQDLKMGKGIALSFRKKFGGVDKLLKQNKKVNEVAILKKDNKIIFNLITKENYWDKPTYESLTSTLKIMKEYCIENNIKTLSMPRIGCGLDKLEWPQVSNIIKDVFKSVDIKILIFILSH